MHIGFRPPTIRGPDLNLGQVIRRATKILVHNMTYTQARLFDLGPSETILNLSNQMPCIEVVFLHTPHWHTLLSSLLY